jgi:hypothetical protein
MRRPRQLLIKVSNRKEGDRKGSSKKKKTFLLIKRRQIKKLRGKPVKEDRNLQKILWN